MSESVDTRVVEAKFDSEQFEKGVDKTVKKLDELKKSLNLKDAGDSIAELADKTQKASTKASESLEKLETRFTSFAGMLRQKFISGIADEIVGVFFRIKSSFEGLVHSLSSAQVSYGMQRYNDILTSVRTLVSAGETQDSSYKVIERLGEYADQTSYSLDALVSTMSKFKTSGASLSTAQRMVEGLSNAAASMGVNAQDAQRAYLNLQQAYSKGAMLQNDWISFESIPMVGTKFNQRIIDAAIAVGTLEVDKKNGGYKTKGGKGSEVKTKGADATGITAENLGTKLSSRWFNKAVMEKVFGEDYYFSIVDPEKVNEIKDVERGYREQLKLNAITQEEYNQKMEDYFAKLKTEQITEKQEELNELLKNNKITQEEYNRELKEFTDGLHIDQFSWEAFRAGQEARSLTDVLNTLKDTISRGWAKSFEYLFGKLDEAADLFTKMTESNIANAIYAIGEFRNEILRGWSISGGRDSMLRTLKTIDEMFGTIFTKIGLLGDEEETVIDKQKAFNDRFEQLFDKKRYDLILSSENEGGGLEEAEKYRQSIIDQVNKELGSGSESVDLTLGDRLAVLSRDIADFMEKVSKWVNEHIDPILERIHAVNAAISKLFGSGFDFVVKTLRTVSPLLDTLYNALMKISQPFFDMINPDVNTQSYKDIDNILNNINKVVGILVDPLSKISSILADVIAFIVEMGTSTVTANLSFISDTIGFVLEVLGIGSSQQEKGEGVLDGIVKSVQDLGNACKDAFGSVTEFFSEVLNGLRNFLGIKDKDGNIPEGGLFQRIGKFFETNKFVQDVKKKFDDAIKSIGDFIRDLPNKIADIPNVFGRLINDLFYEVDENTGEYKVEVGEDGRAKPVKTAFKRWLDQVSEAVWNFITVDIPEFVSSIPNFFGRLINDLFYEINEDTGEYKVEVGEDGKARPVKTALKEWLDNAVEAVKKFITVDIPEFVKNIPSMISTFFNSLFYTESEKTITISGKTSKVKVRQRTALKKWLDQAVEDVKKFITKDMPAKIKSIPSIVSEFIDKLLYTEKTDKNGNIIKDAKTGKPIKFFTDFHAWLDTLVNNIGDFISNFINNLPNYINTGINAVGGFIRGIVSAIFDGGDAQDAGQEIQEELEKPFQNISLSGIIDSIKSIGRTILNNIISIFTGSTDWETNKNSLAEGVANAISRISEKAESAWNTARAFFISLPGKISGFFSGEPEEGSENGEKTVTDSISTFINNVGKAISEIPNDLLTFWKNAEKEVGKLWNTIVSYITGEKQVGTFSEDEYNKQFADMLSRSYTPQIAKEQAERYKKNALGDIAYNIDSFFNNLVEYISEKVSNFPENLVNGINTGATILGSALETITKLFEKEDAVDKAKELIDDPSKKTENGFLVAITNLGTTLYDLITVTLPNFVSKGFTFVSGKITELLQSIGIFKPDDTRKTVEEEAQKSFIDVIVEKIKSLPEVLKNAFDWVNKHLAGFDDEFYKGLLQNDPVGASEYAKYYNNKNPIADFFSNIISGIGKLFEGAGPVILNGINTAISWVGEKLGNLTNWLTAGHKENKTVGDMLKEDFIDPENGKKSELWQAIQKLGETIKKFLLETIPGFIGSAIDEIKLQVPRFFGNLFNGTIFGNLFGQKEDTKQELKESSDETIENAEEVAKDTTVKLTEIQKRMYNDMVTNKGQEYADEWVKNFVKPFAGAEESLKTTSSLMDLVLSTAKGESFDNATSFSGGGSSHRFGLKPEVEAFLGGYTESDIKKDQKRLTGLDALTSGAQTLLDGLGNFVSGIGDFVGSDGAQVLAKMAIIAIILSQLKEIFSLSDELEAVKSIGISIAMIGFTAIIAQLTWMASQDTDAFDRISGLLKTLSVCVALIVGFWKGKDIVELFSGNGIVERTVGQAKEKGINPLETLLEVFAIAGTGDAASVAIESISEGLSNSLTTISDGIHQFMAQFQPTVDLLVDMGSKLETGIGAIPKIGELLTKFYELIHTDVWSALNLGFGVQSGEVGTQQVDGAAEAYVTATFAESTIPIGKALEAIYTMTAVLTEMSHALDTLNKVGTKDQILKKLEDASSVVLSDEFKDLYLNLFRALFAICQAGERAVIESGGQLAEISDFNACVRFMADTLSIFSTSITGLNMENLGKLDELFKYIIELSTVATDTKLTKAVYSTNAIQKLIFGDTTLSAFGRAVASFVGSMTSVFQNISLMRNYIAGEDKLISKDEDEAFGKTVKFITDFAGEMQKLSTWAYAVFNEQQFNNVEKYLPGTATAIVTAFLEMQRLEGFQEIDFSSIADSFHALNEMINLLTAHYSIFDDAEQKLSRFADALVGEDGESGFFGKIKNVGTNFTSGDYTGISGFINMLYQLAIAMQTFNNRNEDGNFAYLESMENMSSLKFDFPWLTGDEQPVITPKLFISEEFKQQAEALRAMIDPYANAGTFDQSTYDYIQSLDSDRKRELAMTSYMEGRKSEEGYTAPQEIAIRMAEDQVSMIKPIDYTNTLTTIKQEVVNLKSTTAQLGSRIAQMRFEIDGRQLAQLAGPYFDAWLGEEGYYAVRGNINNAVSLN